MGKNNLTDLYIKPFYQIHKQILTLLVMAYEIVIISQGGVESTPQPKMAPEAPRGLKICIQAPQGILRRTPERFCPKTLLKIFYGALKMGHVEEKCQFWLFWLFFTI